ncbi:hypothetical protein [Thalassospira sp. MCCC 1A01428]|uniref:hypothetical protein n=1 Tax=Thalassospira sp. MCCC 1A01428 TaxID=1470575 RepID=UPI000A1E8250|nr:hypothetical protein [Thalassospira sp. MCCC 1A01428]OSQ45570.1 hypothetical protein THS27_04385 [Thalassospira sp. MCCC 1A01428]
MNGGDKAKSGEAGPVPDFSFLDEKELAAVTVFAVHLKLNGVHAAFFRQIADALEGRDTHVPDGKETCSFTDVDAARADAKNRQAYLDRFVFASKFVGLPLKADASDFFEGMIRAAHALPLENDPIAGKPTEPDDIDLVRAQAKERQAHVDRMLSDAGQLRRALTEMMVGDLSCHGPISQNIGTVFNLSRRSARR